MNRKIIEKLEKWRDNPERKPLILRGARQVGKTWLMKEFGRQKFENFVYFNFDEEEGLGEVFHGNKNPMRILDIVSLLGGKRITPGKTLIIFDEIQESPDALNSLKYFYERTPQYHIIAAGSLLGTLLSQPKSYPVGMVNILDIYPMTFDEFLEADDENLFAYYSQIKRNDTIEEIFHTRLLEKLSNYLIIGGMPECVASWTKHADPKRLSQIQRELLQLYENDFSKHNGKVNSGRILQVFRSISTQLAKANEKFIYGAVREGGRARDFEEAIEWLVSAGMLNRVYNTSKAEHPIRTFFRQDQFKLFMFDTGLLKHMAGIDNSAVIFNESFQFKGPLMENYVLQQIKEQLKIEPCYYATKNSELDFLLQWGREILPLEVKAGEDKSAPSLKRYLKENPDSRAVRFSRRSYKEDGKILNIPLYLAPKLRELL